MSKLDDVAKILNDMTLDEKASLLQLLLREFESPYFGIEIDPAICGGDPCVARTRIPVWLLVRFRQKGMSEVEILQNYPTITASDLVNVWMYYLNHRKEIEDQILRNEEDSNG